MNTTKEERIARLVGTILYAQTKGVKVISLEEAIHEIHRWFFVQTFFSEQLKRTNTQVFIELVRAGLWETDAGILPFKEVALTEVYRLAEEQSVVGLVAAGLEHVSDVKLPKKDVLQFVGQTLQLEERNLAMNSFIGTMVEKMRKEDIDIVLLKGQGIAQCYERPLWRACGDVDFFLNDESYEKGKVFLKPLASSTEKEYTREKHLGMNIGSWVVELHGRLYCGLSARIERVLDDIYSDTFEGGNIRSWNNDNVQVCLLSPENEAFFVFTHFLKHFYKGGIGLRQICDWCRLLWTYRDIIDIEKIEGWLLQSGLKTAWKAFAAFAVEYLGMPVEAMPLYSTDAKFSRKARGVMRFVLMSGNFGHNRNHSYFKKYPYLIRKVYSFGRRCGDLLCHARVFPWDSLRFFPTLVYNGLRSAARGE